MTATPTYGFCRVSVPHGLVNADNVSVVVDDGLVPVLYANYTLHDNGTYRWLYFAYEHTDHRVEIIPEFSPLTVLPILMAATLFAVTMYTRTTH